jgi:hypothetical protein
MGLILTWQRWFIKLVFTPVIKDLRLRGYTPATDSLGFIAGAHTLQMHDLREFLILSAGNFNSAKDPTNQSNAL